MHKAYLCKADTGVAVFNGRDTAVRVQGKVGLNLEVTEVFEAGLISEPEFLEKDGDLPWVWTLGKAMALARP